MLTSEWITFFTVDVGAATALAGLMFVAFSIYQTEHGIDDLERRMGTLYFMELLASLVIALAAVVPPHAWWIGAIIGALAQIVAWASVLRTVSIYRKSYRSFVISKPAQSNENHQARVYKRHETQLKTIAVPLTEALVVLAGGLAGGVRTTTGLLVGIDAGLPLQVVGLLAAWYLVSAAFGAWYFLFTLPQTQARDV